MKLKVQATMQVILASNDESSPAINVIISKQPTVADFLFMFKNFTQIFSLALVV